jgi:hypothetical protein
MNDQRLQKIGKNEKFSLNFRLRILRHFSARVSALKIIIVLFVLLFIPTNSHPQDSEFFGVGTIIKNVKKRYKLNAAEVRRISPLIERENKNVVMIYARFGGREPEYSPALWREIIERRLDFESRIKSELTKRQIAPLRMARTKLEQRILDFLVHDYMSVLSRSLELDGVEYDLIRQLLYTESDRKHQLITKHLSSLAFLGRKLDLISAETERRLEKMLTREQLRTYRSLSDPAETFQY